MVVFRSRTGLQQGRATAPSLPACTRDHTKPRVSDSTCVYLQGRSLQVRYRSEGTSRWSSRYCLIFLQSRIPCTPPSAPPESAGAWTRELHSEAATTCFTSFNIIQTCYSVNVMKGTKGYSQNHYSAITLPKRKNTTHRDPCEYSTWRQLSGSMLGGGARGGGPLEGSGLPQKSTPLTVLEDSQPVLLSSVLTNATKRGQKELPCRGPPIAQATDHSEGTG